MSYTSSINPLQSFAGNAAKWRVSEAKDLRELHEQTANSYSGSFEEKQDLPLLERFAVAKLAYDVLDGEDLLTE